MKKSRKTLKTRKTQYVVNNLKRAFTLYELILVCAMLVLISGIVISLVVFMNTYTDTTEANSELISALADIREQTDIWFSRMDNEDSEIVITPKNDVITYTYTDGDGNEITNEVEVTVWAYCGYDAASHEYTYFIYSYATNDGTRFCFSSGQTSVTWIDSSLNLSLEFIDYNHDFKYEQTANVRLRFLINMPVRGDKYICEVIYEGA